MEKIIRKLTHSHLTKSKYVDAIYGDPIARMYFDDWTSGILPFVFNDVGEKFQVSVNPESERDFIKVLLTTHGNTIYNVEEGVSEFVKDIAQCLILFGGVAYELCERENNSKRGYFLDKVLFESIKIHGDEIRQLAEDEKQSPKGENRIDRYKVLLIAPPDWIEDDLDFKESINSLISISKQELSPMKFMTKHSRGESTAFDYATFREFQEIDVLRETRRCGWLGRGLYSEKITEFYMVSRYLHFKLCQTKLRDHILSGMNEFLSQLDRYGIPKITISVSGLPTIIDIENIRKELDVGKVGFKETLELVKP